MLLVISAFAEKWDATVEVNKLSIPFAFELGGTQAAPQGWFFNGPERIVSTSGAWDRETLTLRFAQYQSVLRVKKAGNTLEGTYDRGVRGLYPFHATKADAPDISGTWDFPVKNARGELAWRLVVNQNGNSVSGAILRVDGDTGTLSGVYRKGIFHMSHFSGARPILVDAKLQSDGSLDLLINGQDHYMLCDKRSSGEKRSRAGRLLSPYDFSKHNRPVSLCFSGSGRQHSAEYGRSFSGKGGDTGDRRELVRELS